MANKKIKIIILAAVILLLSATVIFALKIKNKNTSNNGIKTGDNIENKENKATEDAATLKNIEELKNNHPEINAEQLKIYCKIAANNEVSICLGREDEKNCIASVAFIKNDKNLCYTHNHEAIHDEADYKKSLKKCVNDILKKVATQKIIKCQLLKGDDFLSCLTNLFSIYAKKDECADLSDKEARTICEDVFNYEDAYSKYERALCAEIKNEKLNKFCMANIIDKSRDADGDGLTDLEEINKYHTHYLFPDTDSDGISDFQEIKAGINPLKKN